MIASTSDNPATVAGSGGSTITLSTEAGGTETGDGLTVEWTTSGLPEDITFPNLGGAEGNGEWDCANYWAINHPRGPSAAIVGIAVGGVPTGAETAIQLLQYANSQLLEFRHYDELLTRELESVYDFLETGGTGLWSRWRTAHAASKLHTVLLDVGELTERADNAIKFLSDMFSARLYKLAASKVGVPDYKDLVQQKLRTAEELYHFMIDQFNQSRAFVLELMVVVILIIELIWIFRGKPI